MIVFYLMIMHYWSCIVCRIWTAAVIRLDGCQSTGASAHSLLSSLLLLCPFISRSSCCVQISYIQVLCNTAVTLVVSELRLKRVVVVVYMYIYNLQIS